MRIWLTFLLVFFCGWNSLHAELTVWQDAFDRQLPINPQDQVTVILYSNQKLDKTTRYMNEQLDAFKGAPNFRCYVLLDMRGSIGNAVPGIVRSQVRKNLRDEAKRVKSYFVKNGNKNDPLKELSVFIDFDGEKCGLLDWKSNNEMKAAIFNKKGELESEWSPLENSKDLYEVVEKLLKGEHQ